MKLLNKQRGQVAVFYALLIPVFLFLGGVGLDLGWYYLNVSRLQNAADAAVLVGAKTLLNKLQTDDSTKAKYASYRVSLVEKYPSDNPYEVSDTKPDIDIKASAEEALSYAKKNLADNSVGYAPPQFFTVAEAATKFNGTLTDGYTRGNPTIIMNAKLYQYDDDDDLYYVVDLNENIHHFFIGFLDDMNAGVVAVAKLSKPEGDDGRKIIFHANGGSIVGANDETIKKTSVEINIDKLLKSSASVYAAIPSEYSSTPIRDGYEFFRYWTDTPDNGKIIPYAQKLTQANVDDFFATYDTDGDGIVILYAQWRKLESSSTPVTLKFDSNGGTFFDKSTTDSKNIKRASDMDDDETTDPITANKGTPEREGYEFLGWSTNPSADANSLISNYIQDGKQLTKSEVENLFGNKTSVTLYAVWKKIDSTTTEEEVKPHNNKTLWEQMQYLIAKNVYDQSWDVSTSKYSGAGTLIHNSFRDCSNIYLNNYHYYTEKVDMGEYDEQRYWASPTYRKIGEQTHYFLDFLRNGTIKDGNTNIGIPKYGFTYDSRYRTHSLVNVNTRYAVRKGYNDDPLYCNFEGEPYVGDATPIRQIVININVSNLDDKYRPLFFYYEGPDARPGKKDRVSILKPENAQPVILNLNADFKGVLWMPDVPVVINGNGYTFEGFIVAKEYRYLDTSGTQVKYSSTGNTDKDYSNNRDPNLRSDIYVNSSNGNVNSVVATGANAQATYDSYATSKFNLSSDSKFRTFEVDNDVKFMYVFYDNTLTMKEEPFHEYYDLNRDLIPLYKLDEYGNQIRVTKWEDVKLYDSDDFATRKEIPKQITGDNFNVINQIASSPQIADATNESLNKAIRTVLLDSDDNPIPLYDEAGNPVYFCEDYFKLTGTYTIFTLDTITEGKHGTPENSKEFLLTKTDASNVSDTDEWI